MLRDASIPSRRLVQPALRILRTSYPSAPFGIRRQELDNVLSVLRMAIEIAGQDRHTNWKKLWSEMDSTWLRIFVSKSRAVQDIPLQQAFAKALLLEATTPGRVSHAGIECLAIVSPKDWKTFTAVCEFTCCIGGRITPVILNCEDAVYKGKGLDAQLVDNLIAVGLVVRGGTGDIYSLKMPDAGPRVQYFQEPEFTVRPLRSPIPRAYFGRMLVQPHPLDTALNVGVLDFTQTGRILGHMTPCKSVDGFTDYLKHAWKEHVDG